MTFTSRARVAVAALLGLAVTVGLTAASTASSAHPSDLDQLHAAVDGFRSVHAAETAGYAKFRDINGIACIANGTSGAMGVHYVKGALVGDAAEQISTPEAIVYAPDANRVLHLAAVEYIVTQQAWHDAGHTSPPHLFGETFMAIDAPNRYGLPPFYALHVWAWQDNPTGMFMPWNPNVHCH